MTQYQHALRFLITFWRAHGRRVQVKMIRHRALGWKHWLMEWLVLIPYHLLDRNGTWFLARMNQDQRARDAAGD